ncbi:MAG: Cna B-type domain-containing protein, partial [Lachnospiraceae bacterium]|nr:Cna B-type domain-containing protein [Lachnospiraceae bacterium]
MSTKRRLKFKLLALMLVFAMVLAQTNGVSAEGLAELVNGSETEAETSPAAEPSDENLVTEAPSEEPAKPAEEAQEAELPVSDAVKPADPAPAEAPADPAPVEEPAQAEVPAEDPAEENAEAAQPAEDAEAPAEDPADPAEAEEPAEEPAEENAEAAEPAEDAEAPAEEAADPEQAEAPAADPAEENAEAAEPAEDAEAPAEEVTDPEQTEEPAEEPSEENTEAAEPAEEVTDPEQTEEPAEEVNPSEEEPVSEVKEGMKVNVSANWDDKNNVDGIRPDHIEVRLLTGEVPTEGVEPLILNAANGWTGYWEGIPQYDGGQEIVYRVAVVGPGVMAGRDGLGTYLSKFFGTAAGGFTIVNEHLGPSYYVPAVGNIARIPAKAAPQAVVRSAGDVPAHDKVLTVNDDGTYTIALNVTGDSEKQIQKVNVIVIVDRSNSMNSDSGTGAYVSSTQNGTNMYGLVDGEYVQLTRTDNGYWANPRYTYTVTSTGESYTGQRYQYDATASRMEATRAAVDGLASTLLSYNGKDGNPDDTVEMALVSFATAARTDVAKTTSATEFTDAVNAITPPGGNAGGTNWELALRQADSINFGDNNQTYVIFFSDGAPTFYGTGPSGSGAEQEPNMANSYNASTDEAAALATKVGVNNFFTIFAYGSNAGRTYMTNLTTAAGAPAANNYSAESTAELNDAFAAILESIEMAGIGAVSMEDGTTSSVTTTSGEVSNLLTVDTSSYKYYRAGGNYSTTANGGLGEEWTDAPTATFTNGAVKWDLTSEGVLENGVTYTVTFDCWPSQTTLDIVADIKNDPSSYDSLDDNIKKYIDENGNLKTNTTASLSYTDTRTGKSDSQEYVNPDPVATSAIEQLAVSKEWENELDGQKAEPITLTVTRDGSPQYTMTLGNLSDPEDETSPRVWTDNIFISIGILRHSDAGTYTDSADLKFEVLEAGHDFTFEEPSDLGYYWELQVPTVRPMLVDGTMTMLILKDATYTNPDGAREYTIDGKTYYVGDTGEASLTAINHRRSRLNITKVVDGEDADPTQTFPFTINVVDSKASEGSADNLNSDYWVWFSVWNGGYVDCLVSGAEKEITDDPEKMIDDTGWTGYYYAPSGTNIVLNLKKGDNLRFLNLPSDSTYTITEGTLPDNYAFVSSELTTGEDSTFSGDQTTTGKIESVQTDYTVTYTNTYGLTDVEITKVWEDSNNQDGKRPSADAFKALLTLKADGTDVTSANASKLTVTVDPEDENKYIVKWTGLDRYADGKEIKYTVEEAEIDGYTTEGSPAEDHGTITNKHEPEVTSVTVVKIWDDSDDIGEIRPDSIQVQLTAGGEASGDPVTLNESNKWTYTWENLPKYADGEEIVYSADETAVPTGYTEDELDVETAEDGTTTITITNIYTPTPTTVSFPVKKVLSVPEGLTGPATWSYTIDVAANGSAPEATTMTGTVSNTTDTVTFGPFEFTAPGTYTYTVTETGTVDGVKNDDAATTGKTVTITVSDNGKGELVATVSSTTASPLTFTNTYSAKPITASFPVKKVVESETAGTAPGAWSYDFKLTDSDNNEIETVTISGTGNTNGTKTYKELTFTAPGTYTYTVTESGTAGSENKGIQNGTTTGTITVKVADKGDGTLEVTEVSSTTENPLTFVNTYKVGTANITLGASKTLTVNSGDNAPDVTGQYTFVLMDEEGNPIEGEGFSVKNPDGNGTAVNFAALTYNAPGKYTYIVSENGSVLGVKNGTTSYTVEVTVSDKGDGTLEAKVTGGSQITAFENFYEVEPITASFPVKKVLSVPEGLTGPATWSYTINVAAGEGAPTVETMSGTVSNTTPTITFGEFEFTAPGTYTYTVTETGTIAGVTNDSAATTGKTV